MADGRHQLIQLGVKLFGHFAPSLNAPNPISTNETGQRNRHDRHSAKDSREFHSLILGLSHIASNNANGWLATITKQHYTKLC